MTAGKASSPPSFDLKMVSDVANIWTWLTIGNISYLTHWDCMYPSILHYSFSMMRMTLGKILDQDMFHLFDKDLCIMCMQGCQIRSFYQLSYYMAALLLLIWCCGRVGFVLMLRGFYFSFLALHSNFNLDFWFHITLFW